MQCPLRVQKQGGKLCQGIGAKIGRAILTSMAKPYLSELWPAMGKPSPPTTLCPPVGNSAKPLKEVNSREEASAVVI